MLQEGLPLPTPQFRLVQVGATNVPQPAQGQRTVHYQTRDPQYLTPDQRTMITRVLNEQIKLDTNRDHQMKVRIAENGIYLTIDKKMKFFIATDRQIEGEAAPAEAKAVIEEPYYRRSLASSFKSFWRMITNFFHTPAFPNKELSQRTPKQAITDDYRSLRKALELGNQWLNRGQVQATHVAVARTPEEETTAKRGHIRDMARIPEEQAVATQTRAAAMTPQVEGAIANARRVEQAIASRNPEAALNRLADQLASQVSHVYLNEHHSIIIPTGYLNEQGVLQPVMAHFYLDADQIKLEIYSDHADAGSKTAPVQTCTLLQQPDVAAIIRALLAPLAVTRIDRSRLAKATKASPTFAEAYRSIEQRMMPDAAKKIAPAEPSDAKPLSGLVSFEAVVRSVERAGGLRLEQGADGLRAPAKTPMDRVATWIDQISGPSKLSRDEKLNLLYHMTLEWAEDQLKQLHGTTPLPAQLVVYTEVRDHLRHTIDKIAKAINGGQAIEADGVPDNLTRLLQRCEAKVTSLKASVHRARVTARTEVLSTAQPSRLDVRLVPAPPLHQAVTTEQVAEALPLNREAFIQAQAELTAVVSSEAINAYHRAEAVAELTRVFPPPALTELAEILTNDQQCEAYVLSIVERLETSGAIATLATMMRQQDNQALLSELIAKTLLFPHLLPHVSNGYLVKTLIEFLRKIQDLSSSFPSAYQNHIDQLRAALKLRQVIPASITAIHEARALDQIKDELPSEESRTPLQHAIAEGCIESPALSALAQIAEPESALPTAAVAQMRSTQYGQNLAERTEAVSQHCQQLLQAAVSEPNLDRRKALMAEVQERTLQIMKTLPAPGTEGTFGVASPWMQLPSEQRSATSNALFQLEKIVWETQMRLGQPTLSGRDRFLLIKSQAIRQAILRSEINTTQRWVETVLTRAQALDPHPPAVAQLETALDYDATRGGIQWRQIRPNITTIRDLIQSLPAECQPEPHADLELLTLQRYTLNSSSINTLLTQDLTSELSRDAEMESELLSVYHFVARDVNMGISESLAEASTTRKNLENPRDAQCTPEGQAYRYVDQLAKGNAIYQSCSDPAYVLSSLVTTPVLGRAYFDAEPDTLLRQTTLDLQWSTGTAEPSLEIIGTDGQKCVALYPSGHPLTSSFRYLDSKKVREEGVEGGIKPQHPFLPAVDHYMMNLPRFKGDIRVLQSSDTLSQFVAEQAQTVPLAIPPQTLQKLYAIRGVVMASVSREAGTAYHSETAINALSFIADPENLNCLEHEFVQKFLEESLFGPFVMQQALIDFPALALAQIKQLRDVIQLAHERNQPEVSAFLQGILCQMQRHIDHALRTTAQGGFLSGLMNGSLPIHMNVPGGAINPIIDKTEEFLDPRPNVSPHIDGQQLMQPLLTRLDQLRQCQQEITSLVDLTDNRSAKQLYLTGEPGERPVDTITHPDAKRHHYTLLLQDYQRRWNAGEKALSIEDFVILLRGSQAIGSGDTPGHVVEPLRQWLQNEVIPTLHSRDDRGTILTQLYNALKPDEEAAITTTTWIQDPTIPTRYRLSRLGQMDSLLDLRDLSNVGMAETTLGLKHIPSTLLQRDDLRKALKSDTILATVTKSGGVTTYRWEKGGHQFSLATDGASVQLKRTTTEGTVYTFRLPAISHSDNPSETLLAEHGVWVSAASPHEGIVFSSGMQAPTARNRYRVQIERDNIVRITTDEGARVSTLSYEESHQLQFASGKNSLLILDTHKKPTEIRFRGSEIRLVRQGDNWICHQGDTAIGTLAEPSNLQHMRAHFGENWSEYIIPLRHDGVERYLLLPYPQKVDRTGKATARQENIPQPQLLKVQPNQTIQGMVASDLYLAYQLLRQAAKSKSPQEAESLYLQVQQHLQQLSKQRLPSDHTEQQAIQQIMQMITQQPAVAATPMPTAVAAALQLRLGLTLRNLRAMGGPSMQPKTKDEFAEMEALTKLFHAYSSVEATSRASQKPTKEPLLLTPQEQQELSHIGHRLLQSIAAPEALATYFGATGRLVGDQEISRPQQLNPNFLLALLRSARSPNPAITFARSTPLPLNDLLENFWSYMFAIRRDHIAPEQLLFLLQPSVLPQTRSVEEESHLRAIDLQARQFLLSYAEIQKLCGGDFNPTQWLSEKVTPNAEFLNELDSMGTALGAINSSWKRESDAVRLLYATLQIKEETDPERALQFPTPDFGDALRQQRTLESALQTLVTNLNRTVTDVEAFLAKNSKKIADKREEIAQIRRTIEKLEESTLEQIESIPEELDRQDRLEQKRLISAKAAEKREELYKVLANKTREFEEMLTQPVKDPLTGQSIPLRAATTQYYASFAALNRLDQAAAFYTAQQKQVKRLIDGTEKLKQLLEKREILEQAMDAVTTANIRPLPNLTIPEKGSKKEILLRLVSEMATPNPDVPFAQLAEQIVRQAGIRDMAYFGIRRRDYSSLVAQLPILAKPLAMLAAAGQEAVAKGRPLSISTDPTPRSAGEHLDRLLGQSTSQTTAQIPAAMRPLDLGNVEDNELVQKYYTPVQQQALAHNLRDLPEADRKSILSLMTATLKQHERETEAQITTGANTETINRVTEDLKTREPAVSTPSTHSLKAEGGIFVPEGFGTFISTFPTSQTSTTSTSSTQSLSQSEPSAHDTLVNDLTTRTIPQGNSSYFQQLRQGFEGVRATNPLATTAPLHTTELNTIATNLSTRIRDKKESLNHQVQVILQTIKTTPLTQLPSELRQARLRKAGDEELLDVAYRCFSRGFLQEGTLRHSLHSPIANVLNETTTLTMLEGGKVNATTSLAILRSLYAQIQEISDENPRRIALQKSYAKESACLQDCLHRCQDLSFLDRLPPALRPHAHKISYLQYRLGVVLRPDQINTLNEMVTQPALLKQLRMGLGKTSILLPFALEILTSEGKTAIGMVPRALFATNFDEMDETTRVTFDLAGHQFLFSRNDSHVPPTQTDLAILSQKCADFFHAIENKEYILTTIESKASLDDKIIELERSQAKAQRAFEETSQSPHDPTANQLFDTLVRHQTALNMLYRVKQVFEQENTRLIIDEIDQVARPNYSVNAEIDGKARPDPVLRDITSSVFHIVQTHEELQPLRDAIAQNKQFTLTKEEVDGYIKIIGNAWLTNRVSDQAAPSTGHNFSRINDWLAGGRSPFLPPNPLVVPFPEELKVLRKALNSGLRGALSLKVGLGSDFDPTQGAVGIPASQGVTSPTTRYSDPLMQLCLTHMIAMYKPQGDAFLKAAGSVVCEQLGEGDARHQLQQLLEEHQRTPGGINLSERLNGPEPWKQTLRLAYAAEAANRQLIYISDGQISRPVQDALRGCHIIGLTGTADDSLSHIVGEEAMAEIHATGRASTAEVTYRLAKSLPNGLDTQVKTYSTDSAVALAQFKHLAQEENGYNFLINQAGACDAYSQQEIVEQLHRSGRPIIYLSVLNGAKCVLIDNREYRLDSLTETQKQLVANKGFYYYHPPHVRGTHFDIPTGSKGALVLSPTVNANDRDQATYRAREVGEGHIVEPFITEQQNRELGGTQENPITVADILRIHHKQTEEDEAKVNLTAYELHLKGQLTQAAGKTKMAIQTQGAMQQAGEWDMERDSASIRAKVAIFDVIERYFTQEGGNATYLSSLDQELYQGGEIPTQDHLIRLAQRQQRQAQLAYEKLSRIASQHPQETQLMFRNARKEIKNAQRALGIEIAKLEGEWVNIMFRLPETVPAAPVGLETAEVEAEQEAQQEQQAEAESLAEQEQETQQRRLAAQNVLSPDPTAFNGIESTFEGVFIVTNNLHMLLSDIIPTNRGFPFVAQLGLDSTWMSTALRHELKYATGNALPDMRIIVMQPLDNPDRHVISLTTAQEGNAAASDYAHWGAKGYVVKPVVAADGNLHIVYQSSSNMMKSMKTSPVQGKILLTMLHIGDIALSEEQWTLARETFQGLDEGERIGLQNTLATYVRDSNPRFFATIRQQLGF